MNILFIYTTREFLLDGWNWELSLNPSQLPGSVTNELCQVFTFCVVLLSKIYKKTYILYEEAVPKLFL